MSGRVGSEDPQTSRPPPPTPCAVTHDEEFVTELGRALGGGGGSSSKGQLGTYYRVSRAQVRGRFDDAREKGEVAHDVSRAQVRPGVFHSRIDLQEFGAA